MAERLDDEAIRLALEAAGIENVAEVTKGFADLRTEMVNTKGAGYELETQTYDLVKGLDEEGQKNYDVATSMQEMNKRMRERAEALQAVRDAIDVEIQKEQELADTVAKNQRTLDAMAGSEEGGTGLKGIAGGALKAEKAISSLASGHGLGRIGGMLESIMGPMGLPGVGLAIGAIVYELEPAIPKIKAFFDAWEMGVKPLDDVTAAIERLNRAQGETREKRALARIDSQIAKLEDKEDEQGWLAPDEKNKLFKLRDASQAAHREMEESAERDRKSDAEAKLVKKNLADQARQDERNAEDRQNADAKAAHNQLDARRKRVEHAQRVEDEGIIEQANEADRAEKDAARQAETARRQDQARAARQARENTLEALQRGAIAADRTAIMGQVGAVDQQNQALGGQAATPEFTQQIISGAMRNRSMGATIAQAVQMALDQYDEKNAAEFARGMERQNRSGQLLGSRY